MKNSDNNRWRYAGFILALMLCCVSALASRRSVFPAKTVHQATFEILANPIFHRHKNAIQRLYERWREAFLNWVNRSLERLQEWLGLHMGSGPSSTAIYKVTVVVAVVLLSVILLMVILIVFKHIHRRSGRRVRLEAMPSVEDMPPDAVLASAKEAAGEQDYARAFRLVYLAALLSLDRSGIVRFDRSKTNWEYVKETRKTRQNFTPVFTAFTTDFDRKVYGGADISSADYAQSVAVYESIVESLRQPT